MFRSDIAKQIAFHVKTLVSMSTSVVKAGLHKEPAIYNGHFDDIS